MAVIKIDIGDQPVNQGKVIAALEISNTGAVVLYAEENGLELAKLATLLEIVTQRVRDQILQDVLDKDE